MTIRLLGDDIDSLLDQMAEVARQGHQIAAYVDRWVCQTTGLAPSPVCVLRPLADAMDTVRESFDRLAGDFVGHWEQLQDQVRRTRDDLLASDEVVVRGFTGLHPDGGAS